MKRYLYVRPSNVIPINLLYVLLATYAVMSQHYVEGVALVVSQVIYNHANELMVEMLFAQLYRRRVREILLTAKKNDSALSVDELGDPIL